MNIDQMNTFIQVALTGSFSKAGEILYISQPSVSAQIKSLEDQLGILLFERVGRSVFLSNAGKDFLPYAKEIVDNYQKGVHKITNTSQNSAERIYIAAVFTSANYILPQIIKQFRIEQPHIIPVIYTGHSDQMVQLVSEGTASIGIIRSLINTKLESFNFLEDEMLLVSHCDNDLAKKSKLGISDFDQAPFVLFKNETIDSMLIKNAFKKAEMQPDIIMEVNSIDGAKQMVLENLGISILPYFSIKKELEKKELVELKVERFPAIYRNFEVLFNRESVAQKGVNAFINLLKRYYKK